MKLKCSLLILFAFAVAGCHFNKPGSEFGKNPASPDTIRHNRLSANKKRDYILMIDQAKMSAIKDTVITVPVRRRMRYMVVPVKLTNRTAQNMVYIDYSCSWEMIFYTDSRDIWVEAQPCQKNISQSCYVAAHSSKTFMLTLIMAKTAKPGTKFRCSMFLFDVTGNGQFPEFDRALYKNNPDNPIWSNTVVVP